MAADRAGSDRHGLPSSYNRGADTGPGRGTVTLTATGDDIPWPGSARPASQPAGSQSHQPVSPGRGESRATEVVRCNGMGTEHSASASILLMSVPRRQAMLRRRCMLGLPFTRIVNHYIMNMHGLVDCGLWGLLLRPQVCRRLDLETQQNGKFCSKLIGPDQSCASFLLSFLFAAEKKGVKI